MSNTLIIKSDNYDMISDDRKIFNITEVKLCIDLHPTYQINLYPVNSSDYITVKNSEFFDNLLKYCTTNLNYSLIYKLDNTDKLINVWITPIVTSA